MHGAATVFRSRDSHETARIAEFGMEMESVPDRCGQWSRDIAVRNGTVHASRAAMAELLLMQDPMEAVFKSCAPGLSPRTVGRQMVAVARAAIDRGRTLCQPFAAACRFEQDGDGTHCTGRSHDTVGDPRIDRAWLRAGCTRPGGPAWPGSCSRSCIRAMPGRHS